MANPVYKVFRESHIANLGGREAVAPSKAIALPGCKVGPVICEAPAEVGQPGGIALDLELDRQLVAEVADGVFFLSRMVSIKPRLPLRALPRRPSTLKSEDEVLKERLVTMWAM